MNDTGLMSGGLALLTAGGGAALYFLLRPPSGSLYLAWLAHVRELERELRFLFLPITARTVASGQLLASVGLGALAVVLFDARPLLSLPVFFLVPRVWFRHARARRIDKIEHQLDGWLLMLANMLKATASLGDALRSTVPLIRAPLGQELDLIVKEVQLGMPADQALEGMSSRLESRVVSGALAAVVIGRQTGGDLPRLLETAAAALREMIRLEGVVRTKTAEARTQVFGLVVVPLFIIAGFRWAEPTYFQPLLQSEVGGALIGLAVFLWVFAFFMARRILAVDY